jgi:hypothetical protein
MQHASAKLVFCLLAALFCAVPAGVVTAQKTDKVVIRNGDELTGEVKSLASGRLRFKTTATDTIEVEWDHVVVVTSELFFEVVSNDGRRFYGALLTPEDPGTLRVGTDAAAVSLPLGRVAQIERIRQTFWSRLKGSADLGVSFYKANNRADFSGKFTVDYRTRNGAWKLSLDSLFRRQDGSEDLNRQDGHFGYQRFLSGNWLVGAVGAGQRNTELGLDLRFFFGAYGGYHLVRNVEQDLVVVSGLAGLEENFLDDRERSASAEAFFGLRYNLYALGIKDFTIAADVSVFPSLSISGRIRSEANLDFRKEIINDFYISLRGFFSSDSTGTSGDDQATDQGAKSDYGTSFGIGYSW